MHLAHDNPQAGHFGYLKTLQNLEKSWFWPGMIQDIHKHIGTCHSCLAVNPQHKGETAPLQQLPPATHFNHWIHLDLLGPLPSSHVHNNKYLLVITDAFTRWAELVPIPSKEAPVVTAAFHKHWICRFTCPQQINSDQGSEFMATVKRTAWFF